MPVTATGQETDSAESFGKFAVFAGVAKVPARVKCATLAWDKLRASLDEEQVASTE